MGGGIEKQLVNNMWEVLRTVSHPKVLAVVSCRVDRLWALDSPLRVLFLPVCGLWSPKAMQMEGTETAVHPSGLNVSVSMEGAQGLKIKGSKPESSHGLPSYGGNSDHLITSQPNPADGTGLKLWVEVVLSAATSFCPDPE